MYEGKVVVVAGGTGGVGEGIAKWFAQNGATVVIPTRNVKKVDRARDYIAPNGEKVVFIEGNISDEADAVRVRDEIIETFGKIDAMVSSLFGWWQGDKLVDLSLDHWDYLINSSLTTHFIVGKTFIPAIEPGGSYSMIVGLSSVRPVPHSGPISVANAAELMLRKVFSVEDEGRVRINDINLGPINTRTRHPMYQSPDFIDALEVGEIAGEIAFGKASDMSDHSLPLRLRENFNEWKASL
ncbi:SDR family NAD(P)-dependent oxidoreductase [Vagococcus zengguangii]|uniref:SDR family oxidoreductase n=1 Tax=Vagococcus zengguangii TaxID=2571750 RepID=A0A4D7CX58_9ENTE|nr:SDR family oxidoreductase [Vagococcus zengguangii]QCI86987.1 SDR family oxidoreductase [Vagococcus zengguangii]TLG80971.1 SDR family oxidoreductase [Vagococcus zengguangii]